MADFEYFESVASCCAPAEDGVEEEPPQWHVSNSPSCAQSALVNSQGLHLACFEWPPLVAPVRGVVLLYHGIDSNTRYEFLRHRSILSGGEALGLQYERSMVQALNEAGFVCVGADMQSYGTSERVEADAMGYFERFSDIERDARLVFEDARARYPNVPAFALGVSYGGLVTASLAAALGGTGDLAGAVLLAPALSLEKLKAQPLNAILYPISTQLSAYFPQTPLADKSLNVKFPLLKADDAIDDCTGVYTGKLRARVGHETLLATDRVRGAAPTVTAPLLVVHARGDTMCDPAGSLEFHARAGSSDKTFVYADAIDGVDEMWHGLTQEPGSDAVAEYVCSWLLARASREAPG